jgi:3-hydroxyacyl-[acyl-carrier-protein] dehydratase
MTELLSDPAEWAEAATVIDAEAVQASIPQRFEMQLLHGILHHDADEAFAVGFHQSSADDFWVRGHVPGRPLMPGVVMVEAAAQLCAFVAETASGKDKSQIFGFAGLENVRFRGQVKPGDRLLIMAKAERLGRLSVYATQAFVGPARVYEGKILGMSI